MIRFIFVISIFGNLLFGGENYIKFETDTVFLFLQKNLNKSELVLTQDSLPLVKSNGKYCYITDEIYNKFKKTDETVISYPKIPDSLCKNEPPLIKNGEIIKATKHEIFDFKKNKINLKVDGKYASGRGMCGMVASVILSLKINDITFMEDLYMENWCGTNVNITQVKVDFSKKQVILSLSYANLIGENEKFEDIKAVKIPFSYFEKNTIRHFSLSKLAKLLNIYCSINYNCRYHNMKVGRY